MKSEVMAANLSIPGRVPSREASLSCHERRCCSLSCNTSPPLPSTLPCTRAL